MVCVLLNKDDHYGLALSRLLRQTATKRIHLVSAEELMYAPYFCCGIKNGKAFFDIRLGTGLQFSCDTVTTVLNRIHYLPLQHISSFKKEDQNYVVAELTATFTFLFSILPGQLFNNSTGLGIGGKTRSALEWLLLAQQAGFHTTDFVYQQKQWQTDAPEHFSPSLCVLYYNGKCYGLPQPQEAVDCCLLLGRLSGEKLLEIRFNVSSKNNFVFETASTNPSHQNIPPEFITDLNIQL